MFYRSSIYLGGFTWIVMSTSFLDIMPDISFRPSIMIDQFILTLQTASHSIMAISCQFLHGQKMGLEIVPIFSQSYMDKKCMLKIIYVEARNWMLPSLGGSKLAHPSHIKWSQEKWDLYCVFVWPLSCLHEQGLMLALVKNANWDIQVHVQPASD